MEADGVEDGFDEGFAGGGGDVGGASVELHLAGC